MNKLSRYKNIVQASKKHLVESANIQNITDEIKNKIVKDLNASPFLVETFSLLDKQDIPNAFTVSMSSSEVVGIDSSSIRAIDKILAKYSSEDNSELFYVILNVDKKHSNLHISAH